jgi:hypothetical protein
LDALVKSRKVVGSRAMYALGQLVLGVPEGKKADITELSGCNKISVVLKPFSA